MIVKKILIHGRWMAATSALIDISFMALHWRSGQAQSEELFLLMALLDFYAAWYLLRSARVRATLLWPLDPG